MSSAHDQQTAHPPWPSPRAAWYGVFVFSLAIMTNLLDRGILNLLVEPIKADLQLSDTQMGLIVGFAFVLFYVLVGFPIARRVDRGSRKVIISVGVGLFAVMTMLCGLARSFWQLFVLRIGVGVGEACMAPAFASMLSDFFPREKLARAIAVSNFGYVAGVGLSLVVGGMILGLMQNLTSVHVPLLGEVKPWQAVFFICGAPGLIVTVLLLTIREPARRGLLMQRDAIGEWVTAAPGPRQVASFVLQRWPVFIPIFVGIGLRCIMQFGALAWLPAFFQRTHGWSPAQYGVTAGLVTLIMMPMGLLIGPWLAERLLRRGYFDANIRVTVICCAISTPLQISVSLMPTPELALLCQGLSALINAAAIGPENAALQAVTPNQMRGQVVAVNMFMFNVVGAGLGPVLVGFLTDYVFGAEALLGLSLAWVMGVAGPLSTLVFWFGMRPYGKAYPRHESIKFEDHAHA